ncbi:MAG: sensor protein [Gemmatimonadetes bacterium]|nr:sensor protein [Gemmatimonadota bacterium]
MARHTAPDAQQILDGIRDHAIFALDVAGRIATWSAGAERVTGYPAAEALGRGLELLDATDGGGIDSSVSGVSTSSAESKRSSTGSAGSDASAGPDGANASTASAAAALSAESDRDSRGASPDPSADAVGAASPGSAAEALRKAELLGSVEWDGWRARRGGERFWARETVTALRGADGTPAGYAVVLHDETERRRAEAALRGSQATFAGILEIASDAVVCAGEAQTVTFFNRGAEIMFGYAASEVLGQPLEMLIPPYARPDHAAHVRGFAAAPVVARRMGERGEISGLRRGGEVFPAEASISKLAVGGARVFTAVLRDVSARRRTEETLAAQARELSRSNADLEQFAYVASHDLQEPLRMVASYTQLLARRYRGRLDDDADEFIGYAVEGVTRMQSLINDLLAYSRAGTRGEGVQATEMEDVLRRVLAGLGPALEESGARVTHGPLPTLQVDAAQMDQVLQNLVGNALKFRGAEPTHVHVSAQRLDDAWEISVRDNGIGISPEFAERVFVIFQRLHSRAEYPGTGIGLAICKKVVERHGGRIAVRPAPGGGAEFRFTIPDRPAAAGAPEAR